MSDLRHDTVTFLSDYGTADGFVGVVHSVIRQMAPGVGIVDLTHEIAPFDVRGGSLVLARAVQFLCPGVIVAAVDPGVGTARRAVAIEIAGGDAVLVGPDNGLLAAAAAMVGGADRAVVLDDPEYHLATGATTFDGRDVFAPVAAHLCLGVELADLGTEISTSGLMPGLVPLTRTEDGVVTAEVLWVDRFGNVQLNLDPDEIADWGDQVVVQIGERRRVARRVRSFADVGPGGLGLLVDSDGLGALVADRSSAAEELALVPGDQVDLTAVGDEPRGPDVVASPVELGRRAPTSDPTSTDPTSPDPTSTDLTSTKEKA